MWGPALFWLMCLMCAVAACSSSQDASGNPDGSAAHDGSAGTGPDACSLCIEGGLPDGNTDAAEASADGDADASGDAAADSADASADATDASADADADASVDAADSASDADATSSGDAAADSAADADADSNACVAATCASLQYVFCGPVLDGCGHVIQCSCKTPSTCVTGICCKPITNCSQYPAPEAGTCATFTDNCGGTVHCGNCPSDAGAG